MLGTQPLPPWRQAYPPPSDGAAYGIFYIWVIIYGLVGVQMSWLLRPFIGHPGTPFELFRQRQGNFFEAVVNHLRSLLDFIN